MRLRRATPLSHVLFDLGVLGKGIDGVLEVLGGVLLLLVPPERIHVALRILTQHELSEDPSDWIATYLRSSTLHLTRGVTTFAAAYLLWHGVVKIGLVVGLLRRHRAAYPLAMALFALFIVYQLYRYAHTRSPALLALSILDAIVIGLTWVEYRRLQAVRGFAAR